MRELIDREKIQLEAKYYDAALKEASIPLLDIKKLVEGMWAASGRPEIYALRDMVYSLLWEIEGAQREGAALFEDLLQPDEE